MRNFRKYEVWQRAIQLSKDIYTITDSFPEKEKFALTNQVQRAAVSVASNIAEGSSRNSEVEFARYLEISMGSAFEVETQLIIAHEIGYLSKVILDQELEKLHTLQKQLNQFILKIKN